MRGGLGVLLWVLVSPVFSDHDALIHYQAERPIKAEWQPLAKEDPLLKRVCEQL